MPDELGKDTLKSLSVVNLDPSREFLRGFPVAKLSPEVKGCVANVSLALKEVADYQLVEGGDPIPGLHGWSYSLQNGIVRITDSRPDKDDYSGSLSSLGCEFSVTFRSGSSYGQELYKTRKVVISPGQRIITYSDKTTHIAPTGGNNVYDEKITRYQISDGSIVTKTVSDKENVAV